MGQLHDRMEQDLILKGLEPSYPAELSAVLPQVRGALG